MELNKFMNKVKPIFRIFEYKKAIEFYVDFLGFKIDWENKQ
ncbi:MAG TPA: glyoxalase superfamily protein, partial [Bacteroidia bacterium]|nr:glyoxalase superfamily protein [Bacteroidia bacterium]